MAPQALYNQYASVLFGTPSSSYSPNFQGTQTVNTTGTQGSSNTGFNLGGVGNALGGAALGALLL
jgi:hypothetical protein